MKKSLCLAIVLAAPLTACGEADQPVVESEVETSGAADTATMQQGDVSLADPQDGAVTAPAEGATAPGGELSQTIPAAIRGRWGLVPDDCTSTGGDAKGLLVVDANTLRFYESVATVDEVMARGDNRIRAWFDFEGEGMEWQLEESLTLEGDTLVRRESGEGAAPGPLRYARCGDAAA